jgi:tyrosine-protein phosphatase
MTLPPLRTRAAPRGFADIPIEDEEEDTDQNFDVPQSQEEKPESYPNGPIRIYEDGVDLYYEPSVEIASRYDVIFNVASEVKNPFTVAAEAARSPPIAEPTQNIGILAEGSETAGSPDTPKATPITTQIPAPPLPLKQPEYIHIPWEHNTDLVPDLHRLVKVIDDKVQQRKRVLVHCQCGVSRSATLIVAYGIYKNPGITVQEAYDAVKKRSKWIGPNMNLIMQLQEFRSGLLRNTRSNGYQNQMFTMPRKLSTAQSSASTTDPFKTGSNSISGPITPKTAPLPPEKGETSPNRARTASMGPLTAAPLERREKPFWESGFRRSWDEGQTTHDVDTKHGSIVADTPSVDPKGHIVPMVHVIEQEDDEAPKGEIQATHSSIHITPDIPTRTKSQKRKTPNFSRQLPLRQDLDGDSPMTDAPPPPLPDLMNPRSEEFGMIGMPKEVGSRNDDAFGLFSPMKTEFDSGILARATASSIQPFPSLMDELPKAVKDEAPTPAAASGQLSGFSFFPQQQSEPEPFSIMSPTTTSFPRDFLLRSGNPIPTIDPSRLTPRKNVLRPLKTKFSSPNLQESRRLQKLQDELDPKRHMDDLDALMSPRATQFTSNPFHDLLSVKSTEPEIEVPQKTPATPTSSESDPRSPAQHGISPITRNIFDVL